jgi:hypothetical protein
MKKLSRVTLAAGSLVGAYAMLSAVPNAASAQVFSNPSITSFLGQIDGTSAEIVVYELSNGGFKGDKVSFQVLVHTSTWTQYPFELSQCWGTPLLGAFANGFDYIFFIGAPTPGDCGQSASQYVNDLHFHSAVEFPGALDEHYDNLTQLAGDQTPWAPLSGSPPNGPFDPTMDIGSINGSNGSPLTGFVDSAGTIHVFYVGATDSFGENSSGVLNEAYLSNNQWFGNRISSSVVGMGLTSFFDGVGEHVLWNGQGSNTTDMFEAHCLSAQDCWNTINVTNGQSPPWGNLTVDSDGMVFGGAFGVDQTVNNWLFSSGSWFNAGPATGLSSFDSQSQMINVYTGVDNEIFYVGHDNDVYEWFGGQGGTGLCNLTTMFNATAVTPSGQNNNLPGPITGWSDGNASHVYYIGVDAHIYEFSGAGDCANLSYSRIQ